MTSTLANDFLGKAGLAAFAMLSSDLITITRRSKTGPPFTVTQIYPDPSTNLPAAAGDLQEGGGSTYFNPAGAVEVADAVLILSFGRPFVFDQSNQDDSDQMDAVPDVRVGDIALRASDQKTFTVVSTSMRIGLLYHLEIKLKRGPLAFNQKA